jgi:hypothetical protein
MQHFLSVFAATFQRISEQATPGRKKRPWKIEDTYGVQSERDNRKRRISPGKADKDEQP